MLHWIIEARKWIVLGLVIVGIIFALARFCHHSEPRQASDRELIEKAIEQGWGIDQEPATASEQELEQETTLPAQHIESITTADFEKPISKVDIIATDEGDVLVSGQTEEGEKLPPKKTETKKKEPKSDPWAKKDIGIALGLSWDFDRTVEPCLRIQTFRWLGYATAPDPVISSKYAGISINFPLKVWVLKNTSIGGLGKWNYEKSTLHPDIAVTLTVQL